MDFNKILDVAKKNELYKKEPIKCFQTKFRPPSKDQHEKNKVLSEGVQKFLARKEEEEKRKQKEAERRKQELMALRGKDPKANKRIQTMLKRTKSANKSVMEDAIDNNNTADTLAGPSQPDEDDYGFVSETSSQLYNKLIQKMYSTPTDNLPKFSPSKKPNSGNLSNTKERVKMALLKQEEEEKLPHKRKRKTKETKDEEIEETALNYNAPDRDLKNSYEPVKEKPKIKKPLPPPVDFHELLKIAEQKQHEPIEFKPKLEKSQESEILMTKKQKIEYEKMQEWKRQRAIRLQNLQNENKSSSPQLDKKSLKPKISQPHSDSNQKLVFSESQKKLNGPPDKLSNGKTNFKNFDKNEKNSSRPIEGNEKIQKGKNNIDKKNLNQIVSGKKYKELDDETSRLIRERDEALKKIKEKERLIRERDEAVRQLKEKEKLIRERDEAVRKLKLLEESEKLRNNSKSAIKSDSIVQKASGGKQTTNSGSKSLAPNNKINQLKNGLKMEIKNSQEKIIPRQFPPKDLNASTKIQRPGVATQRSKQFPPADVRRKELAIKRRRIESDDEYDPDLDDFIDDGDNDMASEEVSKTISEIFRYDRNKYSKYDDIDDECMESNFAQISKEEYFSSKCGLLEDLADIQREKARLAKRRKR